MLAFLPLVVFGLLWLGLTRTGPTSGWRSAFLAAALAWGLLVTTITEGLSLFRQLGEWEIAAAWGLSLAAAALYLARRTNNPQSLRLPALAGLSRFEWAMVAVGAVIVATVGLTAWVAAPNTWDSMTYHMSRVMHWIQNASVAHYPTHILRQLHQNPWAEFAILHMQVLSGGDRWANLIQWFSMVGAAVGVSLVARQLGADRRGEVFAAVIGLTLPMGILQGSSTQNDYVVSFWLVSFTYWALRLRASGRRLDAGAAGVSLGLAILTKPTAYLFALPFLVWAGAALLRSRRNRALPALGLLLALAFVVNLGHYARNFSLYGSPLGPGEEVGGYKYANDVFGPATTASNLVRNIALELGTPFEQANAAVERGAVGLLRAAGIDADDPRTTWQGTPFHVTYAADENAAGNPMHLVFVMIAGGVVLTQARHDRARLYFLGCLALGFSLFCFYLRWQPWHTRLHLPLLLLGSALVGVVFGRIQPQRIANWWVLIALVGASPHLPLLLNPTRPLIGPTSILTTSRLTGYFAGRPQVAQPYQHASQFLQTIGCTQIGVILGGDDAEYPLWVLVGEAAGQTVRLEHVNVTNASQAPATTGAGPAFAPCAVVVSAEQPPAAVTVGDVNYQPAWTGAALGVYVPAGPSPAAP